MDNKVIEFKTTPKDYGGDVTLFYVILDVDNMYITIFYIIIT